MHDAGPELDTLVATEVLGWRERLGYWTMPGRREWTLAGYLAVEPSFERDPDTFDTYQSPPATAGSERFAPSTNISHAMLVWDHLRGSGRWCCLDISSDYDFFYRIELRLSEPPPGYDSPSHEPAVVTDDIESLPHAICLAALKAVEHQKSH